ncbi:MAG: hypothetical protein NT061_06060 [Spirochaetes bacterium]|nr:hypothetical protein [Spirochaetota bacterium]
MFEKLHGELDFPFERCGIVVVALHEDEIRAIEQLYIQGVEWRHRHRDVLAGTHARARAFLEP